MRYCRRNHYYPFGLGHEGPFYPTKPVENQYKYNGKELNEEFGLNWLSFKFRWYDPAIGRFPSVDPIASDYAYVTPYNYAENEPIANIDLWGLQQLRYGIKREIKESGPIRAGGVRRGEPGSYGEAIGAMATMTDANDAAVLLTAAAGDARNIDGSDAGALDVAAAVAGAFVPIVSGSAAKKVLEEGATSIYRAVSKGELDDIVESGTIRPGKGSMETKLFTDNVDDAVKQGEATGREFSVIKVEVPNSTMDELEVLQVDVHMTKGNTIAVQPDKQELLNKTRGTISVLENE